MERFIAPAKLAACYKVFSFAFFDLPNNLVVNPPVVIVVISKGGNNRGCLYRHREAIAYKPVPINKLAKKRLNLGEKPCVVWTWYLRILWGLSWF